MLIDYVSDLRAPTPTGAAEFAVPVKSELQARMLTLQGRMLSSITHYMAERQNILIGLGRGIPNLAQILQENQQKFDDRIERLNLSFTNLINNKHNQIERISLRPYYIQNIIEKQTDALKNLNLRLDSVSIESVLARGFAWVKNARGKTIYNLEQAKNCPSLEINFIDGSLKTKPIGKKNELQGDLFDRL